MKRPAKRKTSHKTADVGGLNSTTGEKLADRITTAPLRVDEKAAQARIDAWLAELTAEEAKELRSLFAVKPTVNALIESFAESSPYLWELASRAPKRLLRLLNSDPDQHLITLLNQHSQHRVHQG